MHKIKTIITSALAALSAAALVAQPQKTLVDFGAAGTDPEKILNGNGPLTHAKTADGVKITVQANQWWPGYVVNFPYDSRDLSDFGGVSMDIENPEAFAQNLGFRVDNAGADGSKHCNVEGYTLEAGERKTITVWFGISNGTPAFALDTTAVTGVCIFWNQPKQEGSFIVRTIKTLPPHPVYSQLKPRERVEFKFENDEAVSLSNLRGGEWVEGAVAIGGKRSVGGNTYPEGKNWFEFWESRPGLLAGSYSYKVKFQYRVVEAEEGATFYSLFRSQGKGWGVWDRGWRNVENLPAIKGRLLTQEYEVDLPRFRDYFMMLGVNGKARVVVDNIEIVRGEPYNDGDLQERLDARRNKDAERHIIVDFEDGLPPTARIHNGTVTDAPTEVLMGKKSFVVDTIGAGREWNEVFTVGRGQLDAGYKYFVTIPMRMEKKGPRGGSVYICAESTKDGQKIGWRGWNSGVGEDDIIRTTFQYRECKEFQILLGVQGEARVIFDEIEIRREPLPPDRVPFLKVRDKATSKLIFEDNFDGDKLDETKWKNGPDRPHRGGMYRKDNVYVKDGNLVMEFKPEGDTFSSGAIDTGGLFEFTYGLVEARMMLSKHEGHWPGFWLYNGAVTRVGDEGRDGTEVDIMEAPWRHEDKISHCLHWDGYGDDHANEGFTPTIPGINEGWHTFAVDWSEEGYIFLVDGVETWRSDAGGVCRNPLFIILSDEMGGWSGNPWNVDKSKWPDKILVDYVRVWQ